MKSYFERESVNMTVDVMRYNKYYNPKIKNKYLEKNIINEINNDIDEDDEDDDVFKSHYDVSDYDTLADLY